MFVSNYVDICIKNTHIYISLIPEDGLCGSKIVAEIATVSSTS
jgi:hypothetical protein